MCVGTKGALVAGVDVKVKCTKERQVSLVCIIHKHLHLALLVIVIAKCIDNVKHSRGTTRENHRFTQNAPATTNLSPTRCLFQSVSTRKWYNPLKGFLGYFVFEHNGGDNDFTKIPHLNNHGIHSKFKNVRKSKNNVRSYHSNHAGRVTALNKGASFFRTSDILKLLTFLKLK